MARYGAIEAGGTKFICAVGESASRIQEQVRVPTGDPATTLEACVDFFRDAVERRGPLDALGIAAFGPLDLSPSSPSFGALLSTPKAGWSGVNFVRFFGDALGVPVAIDTDVNAAVLAEATLGAARGADNAVYVTVGTGIGGGVLSNGALLNGLLHPEIGHIPVSRAPGDEKFQSVCPFHDDCLEGLASGPAMEQRWGMSAAELPDDHRAWAMEAHYLGQMCRTLCLTLSPQKIVLGGGVMNRPSLIDRIRSFFQTSMGGYLPVIDRAGGFESYIVPQSLEGISGLLGALLLAQQQSHA